jgi:hypothetical protein
LKFPDDSSDTPASASIDETNGAVAENARNHVAVGASSNADAATPAATAAAAAASAARSNVPRQDQSLQTDAFLIYPYEHLFPSVLPSWFACQHTGKVNYWSKTSWQYKGMSRFFL